MRKFHNGSSIRTKAIFLFVFALFLSATVHAAGRESAQLLSTSDTYVLTSFYPLNNKPLYNGNTLSWVSPIVGTYHVYIGETRDSVLNADVTSSFYRGNVFTSRFDISSLNLTYATKYYWRIDVQNAGVVTKGDVNAFINPINSSNYHALRSGLKNSLICFKTHQTARVAFLGGSITNMGGWRDSISDYLRKKFPTTTFSFINAGIPSMGSTPSAFRMERDVLSKGKVDLLFVEAAVNDGPDGNNFTKTEQIRAMEGITRHAITSNSEMDIVFMYFADPNKVTLYSSNIEPDVIKNHDSVAKAYSIPAINLAKEVTDRINLGEFNWATDFQDLHPSAFGHGVYFRSMRCLLEDAWKDPVIPDEPLVSKTLPAKTDPNCYDSGYLVNIDKAEPVANWELKNFWVPTDGKSTRPDYTNVPMLIGQTPDAILTFHFNGRVVGISPACGPDAGRVMTSVDGGVWKTTDLFTAWSSSYHLPWYYTLYSTLSEGDHTLRLKMSASKNTSSTGCVARIRYFYVSGTTIVSAVPPVVDDQSIGITPGSSKTHYIIKSTCDETFSFRIFDSKGLLKMQKMMCLNGEDFDLTQKGVYLVEICQKKGRVVKKIVVY